MSRNLCSTRCQRCGQVVRLIEKPRFIRNRDAGPYIEEYAGMLVANADCELCGARYLAWVANPPWPSGPVREGQFFDLSFRSTFNDEPASDDLPSAVVEFVAGELRAKRLG